MERLDVYLCDRLAGSLERNDGRMSFRYRTEYLQSDSPAVVSSTLPLSDRIYEERDVMATGGVSGTPTVEGNVPSQWMLLARTNSLVLKKIKGTMLIVR